MAQRMLDQEQHDQHLQNSEEKIQKVREDLAITGQDKLTLAHQADTIGHEKDALQKAHEAMVQKLVELENKLSRLHKEQIESEHKSRHWQAEYKKVREKIDEQNCMLINLQRQIALLS